MLGYLFNICTAALLALSLNANFVEDNDAFVANWNSHHRDLLRQEAEGSYAIFELPEQDGTYCLVCVIGDRLVGSLFRTDEKLILHADGKQIGLWKNIHSSIDSVLSEERFSCASVKKSVSKSFKAQGVQMEQNELANIATLMTNEPWRTRARSEIEQEIESGYHPCEQNTEFEELALLVETSADLTEEIYLKVKLEIFERTQEHKEVTRFFHSWFETNNDLLSLRQQSPFSSDDESTEEFSDESDEW